LWIAVAFLPGSIFCPPHARLLGRNESQVSWAVSPGVPVFHPVQPVELFESACF
jgi:hypothetical protein